MKSKGLSSTQKFKAYLPERVGVMRFPALPERYLTTLSSVPTDRLHELLKEMFEDAYISEAMYVASPGLYSRLKRWASGTGVDSDLAEVFEKYLCRMASRATPFGLFAGAASVKLGGEITTLGVPPADSWRRSARVDSGIVQKYVNSVLEDKEELRKIPLHINNTIYKFGNSYRFIAVDRNSTRKRVYRSVEVEINPHLEFILLHVKSPKNFDHILEMLEKEFLEESREDLEEFVWNLFDFQILCVDHLLGVSRGNLFTGVIDSLQATGIPIGLNTQEVLHKLKQLQGATLGSGIELYNELKVLFERDGLSNTNDLVTQTDIYADLECNNLISDDHLQKISSAAELLLTIGKPRASVLSSFCRRFTDRYGDIAVPLLEVLDPASGVEFQTRRNERPYVARNIRGSRAGSRDESVNDAIVAKWLSSELPRLDGNYLELNEEIVDLLKKRENGQLPRDLTAWVNFWRAEEHSVILEVKNVSTQYHGRLFGRFAGELSDIRDFLREQNNRLDDVLIAEIVHLPQSHLGNIATRPSLSKWEIEIRSGGSCESEEIDLTDIAVSVLNGKVFLHSISKKKNILVQMSNAHRYTSADSLGIYYFLNAIADQNIERFPFTMRNELPGWDYLPGLTYDGVIVSRPTWRFDGAHAKSLLEDHLRGKTSNVKDWKNRHGLPDWVALVQGDNVLPFNLSCPSMIISLFKEAAKQTHFMLRDVFPKGMKSAIAGHDGEHAAECLIPFSSRKSPLTRASPLLKGMEVRSSMNIWSDWSQFNIYCHEDLQNDCLIYLLPLVESLKISELIHEYFYVRYLDKDGDHIRLRIKASREMKGRGALLQVLVMLETLHDAKKIYDACQVTYVRELERYGGLLAMKLCESIFASDAAACGKALTSWGEDEQSDCLLALASLDILMSNIGLKTTAEKLEFATQAATSFAEEFGFTSVDRKEVGVIFKELNLGNFGRLKEIVDRENAQVFEMAGVEIEVHWMGLVSQPHLDEDKIYRIRWSILHMRMNRLLGKQHRIQEAVLWELLRRAYISATKNRSPKATSSFQDAIVNG